MSKPTISKPSDTTDWKRVAAMSDDEIDASADPFDADNPESIDTFWKDAVVTRDGAEAAADAWEVGSGTILSIPEFQSLAGRYSSNSKWIAEIGIAEDFGRERTRDEEPIFLPERLPSDQGIADRVPRVVTTLSGRESESIRSPGGQHARPRRFEPSKEDNWWRDVGSFCPAGLINWYPGRPTQAFRS